MQTNQNNTNPEISIPSIGEHQAKEDFSEILQTVKPSAKKSYSFALSVLTNPFGSMLKDHQLEISTQITHYAVIASSMVLLQTVLSMSAYSFGLYIQNAFSGLIALAIESAVIYFVLDHLKIKKTAREIGEVFLCAWIPMAVVSATISVVQRFAGFQLFSIFSMLSMASMGLFAFLIYFGFKRRLQLEQPLAIKMTIGLFVIQFLAIGGLTTLTLMRAFMR